MTIFRLPDLGEGLPDAEIHEWFVKEGDEVSVDQPLVSMETAKAVVDVPSPQSGKITKCHGKSGDVIKTGAPLVEFSETLSTQNEPTVDKGTVVGHLETSDIVSQDNFTVTTQQVDSKHVRVTPAVRLLAKQLNVDLSVLNGTGEHGLITANDVKNATLTSETSEPSNKKTTPQSPNHLTTSQDANVVEQGYDPLRGVRRAMLHSMMQSHQHVVPVAIFDEADIAAWDEEQDITVRLIQAIVASAKVEPALNAWFSTAQQARKCFHEVNLGLAMDTEDGLFVPVIHDVAQYSATALRQRINKLKQAVNRRDLPASELKGASITLSNFGKFSGRFSSPIIVPPTVAILAAGRTYMSPVCDLTEANRVVVHRILPLSLSFDHRAVTGGEATRFFGEVIKALQKSG